MKFTSKICLLIFSCILLNVLSVWAASPNEAGAASSSAEGDKFTYTEEECNDDIDMTLIIDASGSIGPANWRDVIFPFMTSTLEKLNISKDGIHTALMLFNKKPWYIYKYGDPESTNKEKALDKVYRDLKRFYPHSGTEFLHAFRAYYKDYQDRKQKKKLREDAKQVIILVTDGKTNDGDNALRAAEFLRNLGVTIAVVGVGSDTSVGYNKRLTGCQIHSEHDPCPLSLQADWNQLNILFEKFLKEMCKEVVKTGECGAWGPWGSCSKTCGEGFKERTRPLKGAGCKVVDIKPCKEKECESIRKPGTPIGPAKTKEEKDKEKKESVVVVPTPASGDEGKTTPAADESGKPEPITPEAPKNVDEESNIIPTQPASDEETKASEGAESVTPKKSIEEILNESDSESDSESEKSTEDKVDESYYTDEKYKDYKSEEEQKKKPSSTTPYKIAGGVFGGLAIVGAAAGIYKFTAGTSAAAATSGAEVPFDDVGGEADATVEDTEQFRLPNDNDWN